MKTVVNVFTRIFRIALMTLGVLFVVCLVCWHYATRDFSLPERLPPEEPRPIPATVSQGDAPPKEEVLKLFQEVFASKDAKTLATYYHADAVLQDTWARCEGVDAIRNYYTTQFKYADVIRLQIKEYLQQGPRVMMRFHATQRTKDPAIDIELNGAMYLEFADGKIWYQREYWDGMSFLDDVPMLNRLFRSIRHYLGAGAIAAARS